MTRQRPARSQSAETRTSEVIDGVSNDKICIYCHQTPDSGGRLPLIPE